MEELHYSASNATLSPRKRKLISNVRQMKLGATLLNGNASQNSVGGSKKSKYEE